MYRTTLCTALVLAAACSVEAPTGRERSTAVWRVEAEPVVQVGVLEGSDEFLFSGIVAAHFAGDRHIAVADRLAQEVRLFDLEGRFVRRLGRSGDGPGEYRGIAGTWQPGGDTVQVYDIGPPRIITYLLDGTFVEEVRLGIVGHPDHVVGGVGDGGVVLGQADYGSAGGPIVVDRMSYDRYSRDGRYVGQVGEGDGIWRYEAETPVPVALGGVHPFSGFPLAHVYRDSLFTTDGRDEIQVWSIQGELARAIQLPVSEVDLEQAWIELQRASDEQGFETDYSRIPRVEDVPQIRRMLIDDQGFIWVKRFDPGGDSIWLGPTSGNGGGTWSVLDRDGRIVAVVELPSGLILREIRGDLLLGLTRDELGVERVAVHRLTRGNDG